MNPLATTPETAPLSGAAVVVGTRLGIARSLSPLQPFVRHVSQYSVFTSGGVAANLQASDSTPSISQEQARANTSFSLTAKERSLVLSLEYSLILGMNLTLLDDSLADWPSLTDLMRRNSNSGQHAVHVTPLALVFRH